MDRPDWIVTPLVLAVGYQGVASGLVIGHSVIPAYYVKQAVPNVTFLPHLWLQAVAAGAILLLGLGGSVLWQRSLLWLLLGIILAGLSYLVIFFSLGWRRFLNEVRSLGVLSKWLP